MIDINNLTIDEWLSLPCEDQQEALRLFEEWDAAKGFTEKPGYLYLMYVSSGHYKIGLSKNPYRRLKELRKGKTIGPHSISLVYSILCEDAPEAERYWHNKFSKHRVRGEWFELTDDQVMEFINPEDDLYWRLYLAKRFRHETLFEEPPCP